MAIKTWNSFLDQSLAKDNRTVWFFSGSDTLPKKANEGNRAIVINWNTREYKAGKWIDLGEFIVPMGDVGPAGKDGNDWLPGQTPDINEIISVVLSKIKLPKDWLNGKDGNSVDEESVIKKLMTLIRIPLDGKDGKDWANGKDATIDYKELISLLLSNKDFLVAVRWADGKDWVDGKDGKAPTVHDIVANLLSNKSFLEKVTIEWPAWKDGSTPDIKDIIYAIKQDKDFIKQCTVVGPQWPAMKFEDLSQAQLELIRWPQWEWMPWPVGPKWFDWDRVYIQYSPDGINDWSYKIKKDDKFISITVGKQEPQITQFVFK